MNGVDPAEERPAEWIFFISKSLNFAQTNVRYLSFLHYFSGFRALRVLLLWDEEHADNAFQNF